MKNYRLRGITNFPTKNFQSGLMDQEDVFSSKINPLIYPLVSSGLAFNVDFSSMGSYIGSGTTVYDISGNGGIGTIGAAATWENSTKSFFFNNSSTSNISFTGNSLLNTGNNWTIGTWIKISNLLSDTAGAYQNIWGQTGGYRQYNMYVYNQGASTPGKWAIHMSHDATVSPGPPWSGSISDFVLNKNQWYYIVSCFVNNKHMYYFNGILQNSIDVSAPSGSIPNSQPKLLGASDNFFYGNVGGIHIYNRILSDREIYQNFLSSKERYGL